MKTVGIIVTVLILLVILYFAYTKFIKKTSSEEDKKGSVDCSKYWSLNSIDKQYCKNIGKAPVVNLTHVEINAAPSTEKIIKVKGN